MNEKKEISEIVAIKLALKLHIVFVDEVEKDIYRITIQAKHKSSCYYYTLITDLLTWKPEGELTIGFMLKKKYPYKDFSKILKRQVKQIIITSEIEKKILCQGGSKQFTYIILANEAFLKKEKMCKVRYTL